MPTRSVPAEWPALPYADWAEIGPNGAEWDLATLSYEPPPGRGGTEEI